MGNIHRDDVPMDIMEAFEKDMAVKYPGMKVICAGDYPGELPDNVKESIKNLQEMHDRSMEEGLCIDCGEKMPGYPDDASVIWGSKWNPADGWKFLECIRTKRPVAWQCPECDGTDKRGITLVDVDD